MYLITATKKGTVIRFVAFSMIILMLAFLLSGILFPNEDIVSAIQDEQWESVLTQLFDIKNNCVLNQDFDSLKSLYVTSEQNGRWAYENEIIRSKYLRDWAKKQGVQFVNINTVLKISKKKQVGRGYSFYMVASTEYYYKYNNDPETENMFRLGSYDSLDLILSADENSWIISREWYDDPLSNVFTVDEITNDVTQYTISQSARDVSNISAKRKAAVAYADAYCGTASDGQKNYQYNSKYTNYNALGGDCANFASQALFEGGGFKKNSVWNYKDGKGSRAWLNAQSFANYLRSSGRGTLIASGSYLKVYKNAYKLQPGDIIAYAKDGKIAHVSVVTGLDSKGNPVVNCHNADRYRVPWDIGWSNDNIRFYFISVHY